MARSYHDDVRDPTGVTQALKYKNLNKTVFDPTVSRISKAKWHQLNQKVNRTYNYSLLILSCFLLLNILSFLIAPVRDGQVIIKALLIGTAVLWVALIILVLILKFYKMEQYYKLKKLKNNAPKHIQHGSAYLVTDERLPMFSFDQELEKYAKLYAVLPWGMWILRWIKKPQTKANQQEWLEAALTNFIFDDPKAPPLDQNLIQKVAHRHQYLGLFPDGRKNLQKIHYSSANDLVSYLMRQLPSTKVNKKTLFKIACSKKDLATWLTKLCFEQTKPLPFFWIQSCADQAREQDQPNALVLGKTGCGKTLSINIPTILANAYACEQPSFVILDPKGELEQGYAAVLKEQGYDVHSLNVFDIAKSQQWNPLDEGTRLSLMIATLVDFEKQYLNWKRFYQLKLAPDGKSLQWNDPYVFDHRLVNANTFGGKLSPTCDPLTLAEYKYLAKRYRQLEVSATKFVFDPNYMAKNPLWKNTPLYHPQTRHKNDPTLKGKICVIHNKISDFKYNPDLLDNFQIYEQAVINHLNDQATKDPKPTKIRQSHKQRDIYRELQQWSTQNGDQISCDHCLLDPQDNQTILPTPEYVYEFNGGILFEPEQAISTYIDKLATLRGDVTKTITSVIVPKNNDNDGGHWSAGGQQVLAAYINKMFNWIQDWPDQITSQQINLVTLALLTNNTTLRTETFFPEQTYLETISNQISDLMSRQNSPNGTNEQHQILQDFSPYQMALLQNRSKVLTTRNDYEDLVEFTGGKIAEGLATNPNFELNSEQTSRISVGRVALKIYTSEPGAQNLVSFSSISISNIINSNKPQAVFVSFNVNEKTYHDYVILFLSSLHQALSDLAKRQGGRLKRTWMFMLDEFGNLPEFPQLSEILATCRSEGIKFMLIIQDLSQLEKTYKKHHAIRSNCPFQIYIAPGTEESAKAISQLFGTTTITKVRNKKDEQLDHNVRDLITPSEAQSLHTHEWNEMMVKIGSHPVIVSIPFIFTNLPHYDFLFRQQYRSLTYKRGLRFNPELNTINLQAMSTVETLAKKHKYLDLLIRPYGIDYDAQKGVIESDQSQNQNDQLQLAQFDPALVQQQIHLRGAQDVSFNDEQTFPIATVLKLVYQLSFNDVQGIDKKTFLNLIAQHAGLLKIRSFLQNFAGIFGTRFNFDVTIFDFGINNLIEGSKWNPQIELSLFENFDYAFIDQQLNPALVGYLKIIIEQRLDRQTTLKLAKNNAQLSAILNQVYDVLIAAFQFEISGHQQELIDHAPEDLKIFYQSALDANLIARDHIDFIEHPQANLAQYEIAQAKVNQLDQANIKFYRLVSSWVAKTLSEWVILATKRHVQDWEAILQPFISVEQWLHWLQMRFWKKLYRNHYNEQVAIRGSFYCYDAHYDLIISQTINDKTKSKLSKFYDLLIPESV